jgi:hypothetical protein
MKFDIKFPCGYEFHAESREGEYAEIFTPKECPLHGKNCPPK